MERDTGQDMVEMHIVYMDSLFFCLESRSCPESERNNGWKMMGCCLPYTHLLRVRPTLTHLFRLVDDARGWKQRVPPHACASSSGDWREGDLSEIRPEQSPTFFRTDEIDSLKISRLLV